MNRLLRCSVGIQERPFTKIDSDKNDLAKLCSLVEHYGVHYLPRQAPPFWRKGRKAPKRMGHRRGGWLLGGGVGQLAERRKWNPGILGGLWRARSPQKGL